MALVYRHRRLDNNEVFYIGISKNDRRPYRTDGRNSHWVKVSKKAGYSVEVLISDISLKDAQELEVFLIELYGRTDLGDGNLVNKTTGGECSEHSEETIAKIRLARLGDKNPMFGKKPSKETIEKRAKSLTGKKRTKQTIEALKLGAIKSGQSKQTILINYKTGEELGVFNSLSDACRHAGLDVGKYSSKASIVASGKSTRKSVRGFSFKYVGYEKPVRIKKPIVKHKMRKLILNTCTGIFYSGLSEAQNSMGKSDCKLSYKLTGKRKNNTQFIYV